MDQAADMLRKIRDELGITIIWVEHIMGVLMRCRSRDGAGSRREDFRGVAEPGVERSRVVEVYLGTDAVATRPQRRSASVGGSAHAGTESIDAGYGTFQALFGVSLDVKAAKPSA